MVCSCWLLTGAGVAADPGPCCSLPVLHFVFANHPSVGRVEIDKQDRLAFCGPARLEILDHSGHIRGSKPPSLSTLSFLYLLTFFTILVYSVTLPFPSRCLRVSFVVAFVVFRVLVKAIIDYSYTDAARFLRRCYHVFFAKPSQ